MRKPGGIFAPYNDGRPLNLFGRRNCKHGCEINKFETGNNLAAIQHAYELAFHDNFETIFKKVGSFDVNLIRHGKYDLQQKLPIPLTNSQRSTHEVNIPRINRVDQIILINPQDEIVILIVDLQVQ